MTLNQYSKGIPLFYVEYLRNGTGTEKATKLLPELKNDLYR